MLAITNSDPAIKAGDDLRTVVAAQALGETRLCTVPMATAPPLDTGGSPISCGTVEPDSEPQAGGAGAIDSSTDFLVSDPNPPRPATAAADGNPTLGWLGWACSATGSWQAGLSASQRRGEDMRLRADGERDQREAKTIRQARKQEYNFKLQ